MIFCVIDYNVPTAPVPTIVPQIAGRFNNRIFGTIISRFGLV